MAERIEALKGEHLDECANLLVTTFNAEPWNDSYTHDTAKKQLAWHLRVPGCLGLVAVNDGIVAFALGYREPNRCWECLQPEHLLREAGCPENRGWHKVPVYSGREPYRGRGEDRLPRDPQGNTCRGFLREARLRGE